MEDRIERRSTSVRALAASMTALAAALLIVGFVQTAKLNAAVTRMNAVYQKAFYETCELTEGMSVNLGKLLVAGDGGQMQQLLNEIGHQSQGALANLALLPLGEGAVSSTIKFINQTGDFAEGLSVRLAAGGAVTEEEYDTIATLSENAARFSVGMAQLMDRLERGEATLDGSQAAGGESLPPLTNPAAEYPVLLYDGPFSDGAEGDVFRALEGKAEVTEEEAQRKLQAYLGGVTEIAMVGESNIPVACYEFSVVSNGYALDASITKQGGEVLYVLSEADVTDVRYAEEQLLDTAQAFLVSRGYGPMEMSYYSRHDGILTVNYAAVQNGIVLYPDLVKVQLSMSDGAVIGVEAGNYLMNHVERALALPAVSEEEALAKLGDRLTAQSARLAVIPVGASEALCYEIRATNGANVYLVYIDAATGAERELMQVVSDANGTLVM